MKALRFALRALHRDWRSGEIQVLSLALVIAVASVTSVGFFTNRVGQAMQLQASTLLAADLIVSGSTPIADSIKQRATTLGLSTAETLEFPSVIVTGDDTQLVSVKVVSDNYPLRGHLALSSQPSGPERQAQAIPTPGKLWIDPRLVSLAGLKVGDAMPLGNHTFTIDALLAFEPDRGNNLFNFAPRVMFNRSDLEHTQLVSIGSRVSYRLLLSGEANALKTFRKWIEPQQTTLNIQLSDLSNARPEMRVALERSESFLGLAALVAVILSGAAVAVSAQGFSNKQASASAVMRSFGASRQFVLITLCWRLLITATLASLLGAAIGFQVQFLLTDMVSDWLVISAPLPSLTPLFAGLLTGLVTLVGFALPPIIRIRQVPVMRVLRNDLGTTPPSAWLITFSGLIAIALLMVWQASSITLASWVIAGCSATLLALGLTGLALIHGLKKLPGQSLTGWRFGLMSLVRRSQGSMLQMAAFGLGLMALLLLSIVRVDLLNAWQHELPSDAPNFFIINIQPQDADAIKQHLAELGVSNAEVYPMIRGRLTTINDQPITADHYPDNPRIQRLLKREFNLSYASEARPDNPIVAGQWWSKEALSQPLLSIEKGVAKDLGVGVGDQLTFRIADQQIVATISNIRDVQWGSFNVNFFVVSTPMLMQNQPATAITSFYLDPSRHTELTSLVRLFPGITLLDVNAMIEQVQMLINQAATAVEYVFYFTLAAGVIVLLAAVQASRAERMREAALLRALGASRRRIIESLVTEFALLGLVAGLLGAIAAGTIGWVLSEQVFHLSYQFNPALFLIGIVAGVIGIGLAGLLTTWSVLSASPLETLKK